MEAPDWEMSRHGGQQGPGDEQGRPCAGVTRTRCERVRARLRGENPAFAPLALAVGCVASKQVGWHRAVSKTRPVWGQQKRLGRP